MEVPASSTGAAFTVAKVGGRAVVNGVSSVASDGSAYAARFGFCHAAAMAAVFAIGSAGLAFLAASGGAVIAGVWLGAEGLGQLSAAMAAGSGLEALVAVYIC